MWCWVGIGLRFLSIYCTSVPAILPVQIIQGTYINTRTGGGHIMPPPVFRKYLKKRRRAAPPNVGFLRINQEYILCVNFDF